MFVKSCIIVPLTCCNHILRYLFPTGMNIPDIADASACIENSSDFSESTALLHLSRLDSILDWYLTSNETTGIFNRRAGDLCYYPDCSNALSHFERMFLNVDEAVHVRLQGRRAMQYSLPPNRADTLIVSPDRTRGSFTESHINKDQSIATAVLGNVDATMYPVNASSAVGRDALIDTPNTSNPPLLVTSFTLPITEAGTFASVALPFDHDSTRYYNNLPQPDPMPVNPELTLALIWFGRERALKLEQVCLKYTNKLVDIRNWWL